MLYHVRYRYIAIHVDEGAYSLMTSNDTTHTHTLEIQKSSLFGVLALTTTLFWLSIFICRLCADAQLDQCVVGQFCFYPYQIAFVSITLTLLLILAFSKYMLTYKVKLLTNVILGFGALPLSLISILTMPIFHSCAFVIFAWMAAGSALVILFYRSVLFYSSVSTLKEGILVAVGALACAFVTSALNALFFIKCAPILFATLPALSLLMFTLAKMSIPECQNFDSVEPKSSWLYGPIQPYPLQIMSCVVIGLMINKSSTASLYALPIPNIFVPSFLISGIAFFVLCRMSEKHIPDFLHLQLYASALLGPTAIFYLASPNETVAIPAAAFSSAVIFIILLQILLMADFAKETKTSAPSLFATTYCVSFIGVVAGLFIGSYVGDLSEYLIVFVVIVITAVISVLSIYHASMTDSKNTIVLSESVKHDSRWKTQCDALCDKGDLSKRQREVFIYLAKGRNAKYISETLFIAPHTAKTHIYRIYQKLGIHSQQELIDLIDERITQAANKR